MQARISQIDKGVITILKNSIAHAFKYLQNKYREKITSTTCKFPLFGNGSGYMCLHYVYGRRSTYVGRLFLYRINFIVRVRVCNVYVFTASLYSYGTYLYVKTYLSTARLCGIYS